ncbi:MAG: response regulator [Alphaproteobacteria bacterium]|nr:response regulator [Alphaproteobacteria bacterium]
MKILLADDDTGSRDLIARALEADGHHVSVADDGIAANELFGGGGAGFDILIVDVDMPGIDGLSVARDALGARPELSVIVMSAHEAQLGEAASLPGGKAVTLAKPFSLDKIRAAVSDLTG